MSAGDTTAVAIDPGTEKSAAVWISAPPIPHFSPPWGIGIAHAEYMPNEELRNHLGFYGSIIIVETMVSVFGGRGSTDQLRADRWGARLAERFIVARERQGQPQPPLYLECPSATAKAATIGTARGTDADVRRAIIDAYGGDVAAFGRKCQRCKGRGWKGRGRPPCESCSASGWDPLPGPLHGFPPGSHCYRALALAFAAFRPGGLYHASLTGREELIPSARNVW